MTFVSDFIHCNACFSFRNAEETASFFVTSCGHLFCRRCCDTVLSDKCLICGRQCTVVELNNQMSPEIQAMFMDPNYLLKKFQRQLSQTIQFQQSHRSRLFSFYRDQIRKARKLYERRKVEMKEKHDLERKCAEYKAERRQLLMHMQSQPFSARVVSPSNMCYRNISTPRTCETPSITGMSFASTPSSARLSVGASASTACATPSFYHISGNRSDKSGTLTPLFRDVTLSTPQMMRIIQNTPISSRRDV